MYFVNGCLNKQLFASKLHQNPSNLTFLILFVIMRPLTQFQPMIGTTNMQRGVKICVTQELTS